MRFAVMGTGGVGGYYGGRLAQNGHDVTFVARGAHLDAMRRSGLQIKDRRGDFTISPAKATDDPSAIGTVDVVLMCVKLYDVEETTRKILPLLGPDSVVVTLQNGVEAPDMVSRIVGPGRTVGGAAYISSTIEAPGVVRHNNDIARIDIGEPDGPVSDRIRNLAEICNAAGFTTNAVDDMAALLWSKFVLLASNSGMAALTRHDSKTFLSDPVIETVWRRALAEAAAVGFAKGVKLDPNVVENCVQWVKTNPPIKPSMLVDLERGRRLELDWLTGTVHRMGLETGVATPMHDAIYAALIPFRNGTPTA
jgi:2-dehydropantoate 2-reductase